MLKNLSQIFRSKEFPIRWQKEYLHLLTRFEVAIQLDKESILIPSFLPEKPPTLPKMMIPPDVVRGVLYSKDRKDKLYMHIY